MHTPEDGLYGWHEHERNQSCVIALYVLDSALLPCKLCPMLLIDVDVACRNVIKTPGFVGDIVSDGQFSTAGPGKKSSKRQPLPTSPQPQRRSQPAPEQQPLQASSPSPGSAPPSSNVSSIRVGPSPAPGSEFHSGLSAIPPDQAATPFSGISVSIMEALRGFLLGPAESTTAGDLSPRQEDASAATVLEFPILSGR